MADIPDTGSGKRKLSAILHADVVGFSRLMGEDEAGTHRALRELRGAVDPLIAGGGGRIVGTAGDSLLADFSSVTDALSCAIEMQRITATMNAEKPPKRRLELRIGVNLGDVIVDGDNIFGDGVNIAARLEGLAQPGTVCISQSVYEQVRNKLRLDYRPLGSHQIKNIAEPINAYAVGGPTRDVFPAKWRRPLVAAASMAALALAGLGTWALYAGLGRDLLGHVAAPGTTDIVALVAPAHLAGLPSVAVLPFRNLSGDPHQDYFADGITEDVTTALGRFSNLLVIAKSASFRFRGSDAPPAEIGRLLNVRFLLDGSIHRIGDHVRVNAELTEAATGLHIWSENYDAEAKDIFEVQDDIARRVVGAAAVKLTRFERERVLTKPTENLAAYDYVLRGREFLSHATRENNDDALALFQHAIDLDPNYAAAYAALGGSHYEAAVAGWTEFSQAEMEQAEALAQKALALDPSTTSAYRVLAWINIDQRRYDVALGQIDRALEINPSDVDNYQMRGAVLVWAGKAAEAIPWLEGARRFDRAHVLTGEGLCMAYYFLGRYGEAVEACDQTIARSPGRGVSAMVHPFLAATYAEMGRDHDAAGERTIITHMAPFFDARRYAEQFGTQEARERILEGLEKAGLQ